MSSKALVVYGGWPGHQPEAVANLTKEILTDRGFDVVLSDTLETYLDIPTLSDLKLIVPTWTMGTLTKDQLNAITTAVKSGVGIAGCHGGMCDAFREAAEYQFMTGGQWVSHPGNDGVNYTVKITDHTHPITAGLADFDVCSEQYYMHTDPSNHVLATTRFPTPGVDGPHVPNGEFDMPVMWTRYYGQGRVFYSSIGHTVDAINIPTHREIFTRGLLWAACQL